MDGVESELRERERERERARERERERERARVYLVRQLGQLSKSGRRAARVSIQMHTIYLIFLLHSNTRSIFTRTSQPPPSCVAVSRTPPPNNTRYK